MTNSTQLFKELDKVAKKEARKNRIKDMTEDKFENLCIALTITIAAISMFSFFGWLVYQTSHTSRTESVTERIIEAERVKVQVERTRACRDTENPPLCLAALK